MGQYGWTASLLHHAHRSRVTLATSLANLFRASARFYICQNFDLQSQCEGMKELSQEAKAVKLGIYRRQDDREFRALRVRFDEELNTEVVDCAEVNQDGTLTSWTVKEFKEKFSFVRN